LGSNQELLKQKFRSKYTITLEYDTYREENERAKNSFEKIIKAISHKSLTLKYSISNRNLLKDQFFNLIEEKKIPLKTMTLNISSLTTYALVWLLNFALNNVDRVKIIYTSPSGYRSSVENNQSFASGVREIFSIPEFTGANLPGYLSLLVILLGFDITRSRGIISQLQPSKKIGIMAGTEANGMEKVLPIIENKHARSFDSTDDLIRYSIFDYKSLINKLIDIRSRNIEESNITLALTGSKLHAIAAVLFAKKFNDVQLVLSTPLEYYPYRYSYGIGKTFEFNIGKDWFEEFLSPDTSYL